MSVQTEEPLSLIKAICQYACIKFCYQFSINHLQISHFLKPISAVLCWQCSCTENTDATNEDSLDPNNTSMFYAIMLALIVLQKHCPPSSHCRVRFLKAELTNTNSTTFIPWIKKEDRKTTINMGTRCNEDRK